MTGASEIAIEPGKSQRLVGPSYDALVKCFPLRESVSQEEIVRALLAGLGPGAP